MTNNLLNNLITIPSFNYSQSRKEVVRNKMNLRPNLKLKQLKQVNVTWVEIHVTGSDTPVIYTIVESDLKSAFQFFFFVIEYCSLDACEQPRWKKMKAASIPKLSLILLL